MTEKERIEGLIEKIKNSQYYPLPISERQALKFMGVGPVAVRELVKRGIVTIPHPADFLKKQSKSPRPIYKICECCGSRVKIKESL